MVIDNIGHSDLVIVCAKTLHMCTSVYSSYWVNILCAYIRGIHYICRKWSFYDETCGQEDCPQIMMTTRIITTTTMTHENSWLHRLFGINAKWADNGWDRKTEWTYQLKTQSLSPAIYSVHIFHKCGDGHSKVKNITKIHFQLQEKPDWIQYFHATAVTDSQRVQN